MLTDQLTVVQEMRSVRNTKRRNAVDRFGVVGVHRNRNK